MHELPVDRVRCVVQVAKPKPKRKVEDGIFGTSGGIGFTKQNELFVGRVAMIGFAVSTHAIDCLHHDRSLKTI